MKSQELNAIKEENMNAIPQELTGKELDNIVGGAAARNGDSMMNFK